MESNSVDKGLYLLCKVNARWNNAENPQTGPSRGKRVTKGPEAFIPKGEALINPDCNGGRGGHRNPHYTGNSKCIANHRVFENV
jgi:hypothetical protein